MLRYGSLQKAVYAYAQAAFVCLVALVVIGREFGMSA